MAVWPSIGLGASYTPHVAPDRPRVVVVDPDADTRVILSLGLAYGGYGVDAVRSGDALIGALARGRPCAIITELWVPCGGCDCVLSYVRSRPDLADVPLIAHTAVGGREALEWARASGATEVLLKPQRLETLVALLDALRGRGR